jgi:hypothetical protein
MATTINNKFRVFLITGDYNEHFICNVEELEKCYLEIQDKKSIKIRHLWNNRFVKCSKKDIIAMLESLNLNSSFLK